MRDKAGHRAVEALMLELSSKLNATADEIASDASKDFLDTEELIGYLSEATETIKGIAKQYEASADEAFRKFVA